jgi:hypothetical protein
VAGISGEQFALPEVIGLFRSIRKVPGNGELITLSAADPLNLQGILTPGSRIAALTASRILFRDGLPIDAPEAGELRKLSDAPVPGVQIETALKVGKLRPSLRPLLQVELANVRGIRSWSPAICHPERSEGPRIR